MAKPSNHWARKLIRKEQQERETKFEQPNAWTLLVTTRHKLVSILLVPFETGVARFRLQSATIESGDIVTGLYRRL